MAESVTFRVEGLKGLLRAADACDKETKKQVRRALREVAVPVLKVAQEKLSPYDTRSASKLGISVRRAGTVSVEQRLKRTTGHHPNFGGLQMREALIPALEEQTDEIERRFEKALDEVADVFERR